MPYVPFNERNRRAQEEGRRSQGEQDRRKESLAQEAGKLIRKLRSSSSIHPNAYIELLKDPSEFDLRFRRKSLVPTGGLRGYMKVAGMVEGYLIPTSYANFYPDYSDNAYTGGTSTKKVGNSLIAEDGRIWSYPSNEATVAPNTYQVYKKGAEHPNGLSVATLELLVPALERFTGRT